MSAYIVLLHGLGRSSRVFNKMARFLASQGYDVYNDDYRLTTANSLDVLSDQIATRIQAHCVDPEKTIHFVGHSMGALIIRLLLLNCRPKQLGRVVMLAPPNQGSFLVERLKRLAIFKKLYGPIGLELGTDEHGIIHRLPPADYEVGIIAGDRTIDFFFSYLMLPDKNDGKIMIRETPLAGMTDHLVLHATHPFMPSNRHVITQTDYFLRYGKFSRLG